ncbi:hypothetical protein [Flexivirga alba]|uniref:Uncharacterized protein n=1 Tax=Flexivirga alba TaxID=702742 RepID=A0ABW2AF14_9MICO
MFWIIVLLVFLAGCTALTLIVRSRGGGGGGSGVDNHNALQNGTARAEARRNQGSGPFGPSI